MSSLSEYLVFTNISNMVITIENRFLVPSRTKNAVAN